MFSFGLITSIMPNHWLKWTLITALAIVIIGFSVWGFVDWLYNGPTIISGFVFSVFFLLLIVSPFISLLISTTIPSFQWYLSLQLLPWQNILAISCFILGILLGVYDWILFVDIIITALFATILCISGLLIGTGKLPIGFALLFSSFIFTGICFYNTNWIFFPVISQRQFMRAIEQSDIQTVKNLVKKRELNTKKGELRAKKYWDETPLMYAVEKSNLEIVKILLDNGADVNAKDDYVNTALILAVYGENIEKIQLLLSAGADVNIKNRNGETILMTAIEKNNTEIVELLKSAGAKE